MKKLILGLFSLLSIAGSAQTIEFTGPVTSGAVGNTPVSQTTNNYHYTQIIYHPGEVNAGLIYGMKFIVSSYAGQPTYDFPQGNQWEVWLCETTKAGFAKNGEPGYLSDLVTVGSNGPITKYFDGTVSVVNNEIIFYFDTPFNYSGVDNLVVTINEKAPDMPGFTKKTPIFQYTNNGTAEARTNLNFKWGGPQYNVPITGAIHQEGTDIYGFVTPRIGMIRTPECLPPTSISLTDRTSTSLTIDFDALNASAWTLYYQPTTGGTVQSISTTSNTGNTISGLTPSIYYNVWVQADCGISGPSLNSDTTAFATTPCDNGPLPQIPTQDFEGTFVNDFVNGCWTIYNGSTYNSLTHQTGSYYHSATNSVYMTVSESYLSLPEVSNIGGELRFWVFENPSIEVGYMSDPMDPSTYEVQFGEYNDHSSWTEIVVDLGAFPPSDPSKKYIVIRPGSWGSSGYTYIDDIQYMPPITTTLTETTCFNTGYTFNGTSLTSSGTYYDFDTDINGNDSIVQLNLTVLPESTSSETISSCSSYTSAGGYTYTSSGTYTENYTNISGCDSSHVVSLTLVLNDYTVDVNTTSVCPGNTVNFDLSTSDSGVDYILYDETNSQQVGATQAGGSALTFTSDPITSTTDYSVKAIYSSVDPNSFAMDFPGLSTNYINIPSVINFTDQMTLEVRLFPTSTNYDRVISKYPGTGSVAGGILLDTYHPTDNGRNIRFLIIDQTGTIRVLYAQNVLTLNTWQHIAAVFDNGVAKIFVDGSEVASTTFPFTTIPTYNLGWALGEDSNNGGPVNVFKGGMDEFRIWSIARSETEISTNMNNCLSGSESGLELYYNFNDNDVSNVFDHSGNNRTGNIVTMSGITNTVPGEFNCPAAFCETVMDQVFSISVGDITAPVPTSPSLATITSSCEVTTLTEPTANDNCDGAIIGVSNVTLPITSSTTITWTYTDGTGNSSSQDQSVVINDNTAPVPDLSILPTIYEQCELASLNTQTATDDCTGTISGTHNAILPITSSTIITWTYDDGNGNTTSQTQEIIIDDNISPVPDVTVLSAITGECSITSLNAPTSTDACAGTIVGTTNTILPITSNTTITWVYDDGNGNIETQAQEVVLNDVTAPVPTLSSLPIIEEQCEVTSLTAPTALDNCDGTITATTNATLPISTSETIVWTYTDASGNSTTQNQLITFDDYTEPVPDLSVLGTLSDACMITSLTPPTATDNCVGQVIGTHNVSLPITSSTTVVWSFEDDNGNVSTQNQAVIISDSEAPVADAATLDDVVESCEVTAIMAPTATDNCAGTITGTTSTIFPITLSTTVTWEFTDGSGNTSTQDQVVIINDTDAPVADVSTLPAINEICTVTSLTSPTATDNCSGSLIGTHNATLPINASTTVTWTYEDQSGNISTQEQEVVITPINDAVTVSGGTLTSAQDNADIYQWIDCIASANIISAGNNQSFTPEVDGEYAVEVTVNGCFVISECILIEGLGVKESSVNAFEVYPNPTKGKITINFKENQASINAIVFDMTGKVISELSYSNQRTINLEINGPIGVYFVQITDQNNNQITQKVIKQ